MHIVGCHVAVGMNGGPHLMAGIFEGQAPNPRVSNEQSPKRQSLPIEVIRITRSDDLEALVTLINSAEWDEDNDVDTYSVAALEAYLCKEDTVFIAACCTDGEKELVGMASGRIELKPYDHMKWLYIDEVDTCANQRRKGVGRALMVRLLEIARESDCEEVWLGTESTNVAANALYKSLVPDEVDHVVGYLFEIR